jgi:hypothetical protein
MSISPADALSWFFLAIGFVGLMAIVSRLVKFALTALFGKNIRITYVDSNGLKQSKKFRIDKDDELIALMEIIKSNKELQRHFFSKEH